MVNNHGNTVYIHVMRSNIKNAYKKLQSIDEGFEGYFLNHPSKMIGSKEDISLIDFFDGYRTMPPSDTVFVKLENGDRLTLQIKDRTGVFNDIFEGHMSNKKTFKIIRYKSVQQFPPFIPLFYNRKDIHIIWLSIDKKGNLILNKTIESSFRFLIFADGRVNRSRYFFQRIN